MADALHEPFDDEMFADAPTTTGLSEELIIFRLDEEWYGVRIAQVRAVLTVSHVTYIPSAPWHVVGVVNVRGTLVSVTDPKHLLRLSSHALSAQSPVVIIEHAGVQTGLLVDHVARVIQVPRTQLERPSTLLAADRLQYVEALFQWDGRVVGVLRVDQLVWPDAQLSAAHQENRGVTSAGGGEDS